MRGRRGSGMYRILALSRGGSKLSLRWLVRRREEIEESRTLLSLFSTSLHLARTY